MSSWFGLRLVPGMFSCTLGWGCFRPFSARKHVIWFLMDWGWLLFTIECCAFIWVNSLGIENETGAALWSVSIIHSFSALSLWLGHREWVFQGKHYCLGDVSKSGHGPCCLPIELIYHGGGGGKEDSDSMFDICPLRAFKLYSLSFAPYLAKLKRKPGTPVWYSDHAAPGPCSQGPSSWPQPLTTI